MLTYNAGQGYGIWDTGEGIQAEGSLLNNATAFWTFGPTLFLCNPVRLDGNTQEIVQILGVSRLHAGGGPLCHHM